MPSQKYALRFKNRSGSQHDFLCYQQGIDINSPYIYTLAWFAEPVANGVDVDFTWTLDFDFVWSEQGTLSPGITFREQQVIPAKPQKTNRVTLTDIDNAFQFGTPDAGGTAGSLTIDCDDTIPKGVVTVGIGMSGSATHVVAAEPNFAIVFTPRTEYWIGFGSFVQGQVLDIQTMVNAEQVAFPVNVYGMTATLDSGNNWSLQQGLV